MADISQVVSAIHDWCYLKNRFSFTVLDLRREVSDYKEDDLKIACCELKKNDVFVLKSEFLSILDDPNKVERRQNLFKRLSRTLLPDVDRSVEKPDPKFSSEHELINIAALERRSDDVIRQVSNEREARKLLDRESFIDFVKSSWKIEIPQLDLMLIYLKMVTITRIEEAKRQLAEADEHYKAFAAENSKSFCKTVWAEKRRSFQAQACRLQIRLKFIMLWLGEEKPDAKHDPENWDFLRFSQVESVKSLESRLSALSSILDKRKKSKESKSSEKPRQRKSRLESTSSGKSHEEVAFYESSDGRIKSSESLGHTLILDNHKAKLDTKKLKSKKLHGLLKKIRRSKSLKRVSFGPTTTRIMKSDEGWSTKAKTKSVESCETELVNHDEVHTVHGRIARTDDQNSVSSKRNKSLILLPNLRVKSKENLLGKSKEERGNQATKNSELHDTRIIIKKSKEITGFDKKGNSYSPNNERPKSREASDLGRIKILKSKENHGVKKKNSQDNIPNPLIKIIKSNEFLEKSKGSDNNPIKTVRSSKGSKSRESFTGLGKTLPKSKEGKSRESLGSPRVKRSNSKT